MQVGEYLNNLLLGSGEYALTDIDVSILEKDGVAEFIKSKILSKKFRKWKIDEEGSSIIDEEIKLAINEDRPVRVFFAQGSYKLWRVASSPDPNWAEFFNISYLLNYLAPIASAYTQGVELTYYFLTVLPQKHNNLDKSEVDRYLSGFKKLIEEFSAYLPLNLKIKVVTDLDLHDTRDYDELLSRAMALSEERFYAWPQVKQADYIRRAWLNIKWNGVQDWTTLTDLEKTRIVKKAVLYEYAATQDILMEDKIGKGIILSTLPKEDSVGIGSTFTSVAKHWVGEGVLENDRSQFYPRILSPSQYDLARITDHILEKVNTLKGMPAFNTIEVFDKHFDFSQK